MQKCNKTPFGVFVADTNGSVIKISVPAATANDWTRKETFLDLPAMDRGTFDCFVEMMKSFQKMFVESEK